MGDQHTNDLVAAHGRNSRMSFLRMQHSQQISASSMDSNDEQLQTKKQKRISRKMSKSMKTRKKGRISLNFRKNRQMAVSHGSVLQYMPPKVDKEVSPKQSPILLPQSMSEEL